MNVLLLFRTNMHTCAMTFFALSILISIALLHVTGCIILAFTQNFEEARHAR
jgi:hypothetical protein